MAGAGGHKVITDYTQGVSENSFVKVYVRARPPEDSDDRADDLFELGDGDAAVSAALATPAGANAPPVRKIKMREWKRHEALADGREHDENQQWGGVGEHAFAFDTVFWTRAKQEELFEMSCRPQVEHVLNGYNACAFAYGQTGSGKVRVVEAAVSRAALRVARRPVAVAQRMWGGNGPEPPARCAARAGRPRARPHALHAVMRTSRSSEPPVAAAPPPLSFLYRHTPCLASRANSAARSRARSSTSSRR
jgi:hypothetical protein